MGKYLGGKYLGHALIMIHPVKINFSLIDSNKIFTKLNMSLVGEVLKENSGFQACRVLAEVAE